MITAITSQSAGEWTAREGDIGVIVTCYVPDGRIGSFTPDKLNGSDVLYVTDGSFLTAPVDSVFEFKFSEYESGGGAGDQPSGWAVPEINAAVAAGLVTDSLRSGYAELLFQHGALRSGALRHEKQYAGAEL